MGPILLYIIISIILGFIQQIIYRRITKRRRFQLAEEQKAAYKQKLLVQLVRAEEEQIERDSKQLPKIKVLQNVIASLAEQLESFGSELEHDNKQSYDHLESQLERQRNLLKSKCMQKDSLDQMIRNLGEDPNGDINQDKISRLTAKCQHFEVQNADLRQQIKSISVDSLEIDPSLAKQFDLYSRDIDLKNLKRAYQFLLELKATEPNIDFGAYMNTLRKDRANFSSILTDLNIKNKEAEIKLQGMVRQQETSDLNEERIELVLKLHIVGQLLEDMKTNNEMIKAAIKVCKDDVTEQKSKINKFRDDYEVAVSQRDKYLKASIETSSMYQSLSFQENENPRYLSMSSASSFAGSMIPSPPPVEIPSMEEIMRTIK